MCLPHQPVLNQMMQLLKQSSQQSARQLYALLLLLTLIWLGLIAAAPLLLHSEHPWPALVLYRSFAVVCHQRPDRSFHLFDLPLAVCARCTGIYAGFLLGLLLCPLARRLEDDTLPQRKWLWLAVVPMLLDVAGNEIGLFTNTFASRLLTGLLAGAVTAFYLWPGLLAAFWQFTGGADSRFRLRANTENLSP